MKAASVIRMIKKHTFSAICGISMLISIGFALPARAALDVDGIPLAARMVLAKATEFLKQKSYDRAIATLTAFQAKGGAIPAAHRPDPKGYHHPAIYYLLGNCHLLQNKYLQAGEAYQHAVEQDPDFSDAWANLAKTCFEQEDYIRAASCFASAYETSGRSGPDHLYFSAVSYLMADQYSLSVSAFQRLFENHADCVSLPWRAHYAQALIADGQARRALPLIRILAEKSTGADRTKWQEILLYQYLQLEMHNEALAYATELTRSECTRAIWWKALAHVELSGGRHKKALAALTIYSYLTPLTPTEQKLWADLNLQLNIPTRAIAQYRALLSQKFDAEALKNMVFAYQSQDRFQEGLDQLNHYAPDTDDPEILMLKADMLYALKQYADAGVLFRQVAERQTSHAGQAWLMAGYAAWQCNDDRAGRQAFQSAAKHQRYRKAAQMAMHQMEEAVHRGEN